MASSVDRADRFIERLLARRLRPVPPPSVEVVPETVYERLKRRAQSRRKKGV